MQCTRWKGQHMPICYHARSLQFTTPIAYKDSSIRDPQWKGRSRLIHYQSGFLTAIFESSNSVNENLNNKKCTRMQLSCYGGWFYDGLPVERRMETGSMRCASTGDNRYNRVPSVVYESYRTTAVYAHHVIWLYTTPKISHRAYGGDQG